MLDQFHKPQPHTAPNKATVASVLEFIGTKGNQILSLLTGLLAASLILFSSYILYDTFYTENQAFSNGWELLKYKPVVMEGEPIEGQDTLAGMLNNYRAWLTMYDTHIDYPVMQGKNDLFYASHDIYGEPSLTGNIYLAAENTPDFSDSYNLIYGHHMDNGAMFGALDEYLKESYIQEHSEGILISTKSVWDLEVFAVLKTNAYEKTVYDVGPDKTVSQIMDFLQNPPEHSSVEYLNMDVAEGMTKITALSTCASAETDGRLVVFCKTTLKNLIQMEMPSYEGIYDGTSHTLEAIASHTEGTVIEYSLDGGKTWSEEPPSITDVGSVDVMARATNKDYGTVITTATMTVHPKPVTVTANSSGKTYGEPDPKFTASVEGVIDDQKLEFTVTRPKAGTEENIGVYENAIVPAGEKNQGNYVITYVPNNFEIVSSDNWVLIADGYKGIYDGKSHMISVVTTVREGTLIEYSTDGGKTWSSKEPTIRDVGKRTVMVRAHNPNFDDLETTVVLEVLPRKITVTAEDAKKIQGQSDPEFTAIVDGLLNGESIQFTISRVRGEAPGTYDIIPAGDELQGNYEIEYIRGTMVIEGEKPKIPDNSSPHRDPNDKTAPYTAFFTPRGTPSNAWALVNLLCILAVAYLFLPLLHLRDKYRRRKKMEKYNQAKTDLWDKEDISEEEVAERKKILKHALKKKYPDLEDCDMEAVLAEADPDGAYPVTEEEFTQAVEDLYYHEEPFEKRFRWGFIGVIALLIISVIVFILTEDIRTPMILIDQWTPIMLLLLAIAWFIDWRLAKYRENEVEESAEEFEAKSE